MTVRYDPHATFQIERRKISEAWVEAALREPDETESHDDKLSFLKRILGRAEMLRVVTRAHEPDYVITAYFDRRRPCE
jgi:glutamine synthetase